MEDQVQLRINRFLESRGLAIDDSELEYLSSAVAELLTDNKKLAPSLIVVRA